VINRKLFIVSQHAPTRWNTPDADAILSVRPQVRALRRDKFKKENRHSRRVVRIGIVATRIPLGHERTSALAPDLYSKAATSTGGMVPFFPALRDRPTKRSAPIACSTAGWTLDEQVRSMSSRLATRVRCRGRLRIRSEARSCALGGVRSISARFRVSRPDHARVAGIYREYSHTFRFILES